MGCGTASKTVRLTWADSHGDQAGLWDVKSSVAARTSRDLRVGSRRSRRSRCAAAGNSGGSGGGDIGCGGFCGGGCGTKDSTVGTVPGWGAEDAVARDVWDRGSAVAALRQRFSGAIAGQIPVVSSNLPSGRNPGQGTGLSLRSSAGSSSAPGGPTSGGGSSVDCYHRSSDCCSCEPRGCDGEPPMATFETADAVSVEAPRVGALLRTGPEAPPGGGGARTKEECEGPNSHDCVCHWNTSCDNADRCCCVQSICITNAGPANPEPGIARNRVFWEALVTWPPQLGATCASDWHEYKIGVPPKHYLRWTPWNWNDANDPRSYQNPTPDPLWSGPLKNKSGVSLRQNDAPGLGPSMQALIWVSVKSGCPPQTPGCLDCCLLILVANLRGRFFMQAAGGCATPGSELCQRPPFIGLGPHDPWGNQRLPTDVFDSWVNSMGGKGHPVRPRVVAEGLGNRKCWF